MRRLVALGLVLCLVSSGVSGCSQPIDTGSSIPAQSQPIVALLALLAVGIGLTAYHHHNEHRGGGPGAAIVPVARIFGPASGYRFIDTSSDSSSGSTAGLESPTGSGPFLVTEVPTSTIPDYFLPTGYAPTALALDPSANAWFVDTTGNVKQCIAPTSTGTTCAPAFSASDGLTAGSRSIAVDGSANVVIVKDAGSGNVDVAYFLGGGGTVQHTSYKSVSNSSIYSTDAIVSIGLATGGNQFAVYHQDGSSDLITLPFATASSFAYNPLPLVAPSNVESDLNTGNFAYFGLTGSPTGTYEITRYESPSGTGISFTSTTSIIIENGGAFGGQPFSGSLSSIRADAGLDTFAIDSAGNVVEFAGF